MRGWVPICVVALGGIANASAMPQASGHSLRLYMTSITPKIQTYRQLLKRADRLLTEEPRENVDPLVDRLFRLADRFDDLSGRWDVIRAPSALRRRHHSMTSTFALEAQAFRIWAFAVFTRHLEDREAARPMVGQLLVRAAALQTRWAAALWRALVRAKIRVPVWLDQMAHPPP